MSEDNVKKHHDAADRIENEIYEIINRIRDDLARIEQRVRVMRFHDHAAAGEAASPIIIKQLLQKRRRAKR